MRSNAQDALKGLVDLDPISNDETKPGLKSQWVKALMPPSKKNTH